MSLAEFVRILGRGPGRSRSLDRDEAVMAMEHMLDGAAPEAVGALLMLLRMKGETPDEIAGFAEAAQGRVPLFAAPALDWPCYSAGRTRGQPFFVLAARLVADAGYPVLLHGLDPAPLRAGLEATGTPVLNDLSQAKTALTSGGMAYLPMDVFAPELAGLLRLRSVLGLRSCINTVARMVDPGRAGVSVQGVFHPSYQTLQAEAGALLNRQALSIIKGGGGEFERHPGKALTVGGLRGGAFAQTQAPALMDETRRLNTADADLGALWSGQAQDSFAEAIVLGTAELALETLGAAEPADLAARLWHGRRAAVAA